MAQESLKQFVSDQVRQAEFKARAYVFDRSGKKRPNRNIFVKMRMHLDAFLSKKSEVRWITLTGLRGAGKTTILYQLFYEKKNIDAYTLVLSADHVTQTIGSSIADVLHAFEESVGRPLTNLDKPLLLFIDEVQYDLKWAVTLKTLYDQTNNVFIFSTGSSALLMNTNADVARRTVFEKVFPLSFTEYLKIQQGKYEEKGFAAQLRDILFQSKDAEEVFEKIQKELSVIDRYYFGVSRFDFSKYLQYGSLPFMITLENEAIVYDQIQKTIDRVISLDVPRLDRFDVETISAIPAMLYAVADMQEFNFSTLAERFDLSRLTVSEIFSALEKTELLQRVYGQGSHLNQVSINTRGPSKYLFSSPAFRAMYYKMIGNTISLEQARGKFLEDLVGMYFHRVAYKNPTWALTYDSAKGGSDFIVTIGKEKIAVEVGVQKKTYKQVRQTGDKIRSKYNLVISERAEAVKLDTSSCSVRIPLRIFLLI